MKSIRSLVFGSTLALSVVVPTTALTSSTGCTKQQGDTLIHDVSPVISCATNALADALLLGVTDPAAIISQCAGLTFQALANLVRDMLTAPNTVQVDDSGVGFDPRPQMAQAARQAHLQAVQQKLAQLGVSAQ